MVASPFNEFLRRKTSARGAMNLDSGGQAIRECESRMRRRSEVPLRKHPMTKIGGSPSDRSQAPGPGTSISGASGSVRWRREPAIREIRLLLTTCSSGHLVCRLLLEKKK